MLKYLISIVLKESFRFQFVHFPIRSYEDSGSAALLFSVTFLDSQHNFQIINFLKIALSLKALLRVSE